jgi:hypothetical protein
VHEVALDLRLARAPEIVVGDRRAVERIRPEDPLVRPQDFAVLERKRVERSPEFLLRENQRDGQALAFPLVGHTRARFEIADAERFNKCKAGERRVAVALNLRTVCDECMKAAAEDMP